jgi:hypothetical protein
MKNQTLLPAQATPICRALESQITKEVKFYHKPSITQRLSAFVTNVSNKWVTLCDKFFSSSLPVILIYLLVLILTVLASVQLARKQADAYLAPSHSSLKK